MSEGFENLRAHDPSPKERYSDSYDSVMPAAVGSPGIGGVDKKELHSKLYGLWMAEMERQHENRVEAAIDEDFFDNEQWTDLEKDLIEEIGHVPMTINVIGTTINWLLGTERRGRTDYKILPRQKRGSQAAERKSQLLKYIADVNRSEFAWSQAFADAVKAGVGWIECGVQGDDEGEPIYERRENWRNILADSAADDIDVEDGRFIFRHKFTDLDTACAFFPDSEDVIRDASERTMDLIRDTIDDPSQTKEDFLDGTTSGAGRISLNERRRVRMIEGWFKLPVMEKRIKGGDFRGELYDPSSPGHAAEIEEGRAEIVERVTNRMFVVIFTSAGIVWHSPSPYRHNRYPFTPIWAYRRAKDGQPYGVIRGLRDLQRNVNKRFAHALFLLVHNKIIMDEGAVDDIDALEDEVNRPTAIIEKKPGYQLEIGKDKELTTVHLELMSQSIQMIQSTSGVTDENLGRETNAHSGRAIIARQEQGALATAPLFDNLRLARQIAGEKMLSLVEQFMTDEKEFRITNQRGTPEFITINDGMPENDIIRTKADYIISEAAWQATLRRADSAELSQLMRDIGPVVGPQVILGVLDLLIETMDLPNGDEIVKRVRQITGMEDPDADPTQPDPERDARMAAQAKQAQYAEDMANAQLAKTQGEAAEKLARADKTKAELKKLIEGLPTDRIAAKNAALELAMALITASGAADTADAILQESGYEGGAPLPQVPEAPEANEPVPEAQEVLPEPAEALPQGAMPTPQPAPMPMP